MKTTGINKKTIGIHRETTGNHAKTTGIKAKTFRIHANTMGIHKKTTGIPDRTWGISRPAKANLFSSPLKQLRRLRFLKKLKNQAEMKRATRNRSHAIHHFPPLAGRSPSWPGDNPVPVQVVGKTFFLTTCTPFSRK